MIEDTPSLLPLVVDIVCAYVANHAVSPAALPALIDNISATLAGLSCAAAPLEPPQPALTPAQIRKSVTPEHITCFENGHAYRSLTRHLRAAYGLSPDEYRAKWGLPSDYPMVAPNYAAVRSQLARRIGLGKVKTGK